MEYADLGNTGDRISVVGFGGWAIGGHGYGPVDDSRSVAAVREALELGFTLFDTADVYGFGHSEEILSKALGARIRDLVVATKFGIRWDTTGRTWKDSSPDYMRSAVEGSLKRLKTDCIPLYQLHWHDGVTPLPDVFEALHRLREEGKIRQVGCSNIPSGAFAGGMGVPGPVSAQVRFGLAHRRRSADLEEFHARHGMATLVYGVLARGLFSGKYGKDASFGESDTREKDPDFRERFDRNSAILEGIRTVAGKYGRTPGQVAIRWALEHDFVTCALVGAKSGSQVRENAGALGWSLKKEDRDYLDSLSAEDSWTT